MKPFLFSLALLLSNLSFVLAQYSYEFDYQDPNPALEYSLNEILGESSYAVFTFDADSLYEELYQTTDSVGININMNNESSFEILLDNYSLTSEFVDNPSGSYSKIGRIVGEPSSYVFAHFSPNYFWINIKIGSTEYKIVPVRSLSESLIEYKTTYVFEEQSQEVSSSSSLPVPIDDACSEYFIELFVVADKLFYIQQSQDADFILDNLKSHVAQVEK
jgi:hypothetical protein